MIIADLSFVKKYSRPFESHTLVRKQFNFQLADLTFELKVCSCMGIKKYEIIKIILIFKELDLYLVEDFSS